MPNDEPETTVIEFADIEEATALIESLDPKRVISVSARIYRTVPADDVAQQRERKFRPDDEAALAPTDEPSPDTAEDGQPYTCDDCGRQFESRHALYGHERWCEDDERAETADADASPAANDEWEVTDGDYKKIGEASAHHEALEIIATNADDDGISNAEIGAKMTDHSASGVSNNTYDLWDRRLVKRQRRTGRASSGSVYFYKLTAYGEAELDRLGPYVEGSVDEKPKNRLDHVNEGGSYHEVLSILDANGITVENTPPEGGMSASEVAEQFRDTPESSASSAASSLFAGGWCARFRDTENAAPRYLYRLTEKGQAYIEEHGPHEAWEDDAGDETYQERFAKLEGDV